METAKKTKKKKQAKCLNIKKAYVFIYQKSIKAENPTFEVWMGKG